MGNFHLVRRADYSIKRVIIYYLIGILISLSIGAILLMSLNINPIEYYSRMLSMGLIGNKFAYKNGITTMPTILLADMYGPLDRISMAKMLSQYAINVL